MPKLKRLLLKLIMFFISIWLFFLIFLAFFIHFWGQNQSADQPADAIIMLGAGLRSDGSPSPAMRRRADQTIQLWQSGLADFVICTGGFTSGHLKSEAQTCKELLISAGIPEKNIFIEQKSHSTEENAIYAYQIAQSQNWHSFIIVSDAYHLLRARYLFEMYGFTRLDFSPVPLQNLHPFNHLQSLLRELLAFHWQWLKDIFQLPYTSSPL